MQSLVWLIAARSLLAPVPPLATQDTMPLPATRGPVLRATFARYESTLTSAAGAPLQRPKAIEFSQGYYTRLAIHRYASYAIVPLFVTEYFLGRSLYNQTAPPDTAPVSRSLRSWHGLVADGIAALCVVNTVTGAWNLWEGRAARAGRTRRYVHAALMVVADAGFVATGLLTPSRRDLAGLGDPNRRTVHRTVAIASMSTALVGELLMAVWNKR